MTEQPLQSSSPTTPRRRRRWPLYVLACVVALAAFVALAPSLLSSTVASMVASRFNASRAGTLEIASLELAWNSRQTLEGARLLAPDGREVARANVELPSLLDLARSGGRKLGKLVLTASAELEADDDGTTNLERALAPRMEVARSSSDDAGEAGEPTDLGKLLRELELEVEANIDHIAWSDATTRASGVPFAVEQLTASVTAQPGEPLRVEVDGTLVGAKPGKLHAIIALHELLDARGLSPNARFEIEAALDELPSALVDALAGQNGLVAAALGATFRVDAKGAGTLQAGSVELDIHGPNGVIVFAGKLDGGVLVGTKEQALRVALEPELALLERFVGANLPAGLSVVPLGKPSIALELEGLRVEVDAILAALNEKRDVVAAAIDASEFRLSVSTCSWEASGTALPLSDAVQVLSPHVVVKLAPTSTTRSLALDVAAQLGGGVIGKLNLAAHCDDLARMVAFDPLSLTASAKGDEPRFDVTLKLDGVGTKVLDAFAPQNVVVSELVGAELAASIHVDNRGELRNARVELKSAHMNASAAGWLAGDEFVLAKGKPIELTLRAPPAALKRALAAYMPEGTSIEPPSELSVTIEDSLRVPLAKLRAATSFDDVQRALLGELRAAVTVRADSIGFQEARLAAAKRHVRLEDVQVHVLVDVERSPDAFFLGVVAALDEPQGAKLSMTCTGPAPGIGAHLVDLNACPSMLLGFQGDALPLDLVDVLLGADGTLVQRLGARIDVKAGVTATLSEQHAFAAVLSLESKLAGGATTVMASVAVDDPLQRRAPRVAGALPDSSVVFEIKGTALAAQFLPPEFASTVLELVGDTVTGELFNNPRPGSTGVDDTELTATLDAARVNLAVASRVQNGVLKIGATPVVVRVRPTATMIDRYVGTKLPPGAKLAFSDAEPAFTLNASEVALPLDAWFVAPGAQPATLADVLRRAAAKVKLYVPALSYTQPALVGAGQAIPVALEQLVVEAQLTPKQATSVDVRGKISGAKAGGIALHASAADIGAFLEMKAAEPLPALTLTGDITGLPTALVDALAAQDGLLVDVLGTEVDVKLAGSFPSVPGRPLTADLKSAQASLKLVAQFDGATIVAKDAQGLDASVPLSPLFSERIVGKLVPLLVHATKPAGAKPVALSVSKFSLPLDGDLSKLNGTVTLDLGEVGYSLLPGFESALALAKLSDKAVASTTLEPLVIPIVNGVAGYDKLPVSIDGTQYFFTGTYDLAKSEMRFATELPLTLLGKKFSNDLDKARDFIDPAMLVPIEIHGTWSKPKFKLGQKFIDDVLAKALDGLLKKGLDDLLGGNKKKKDKKD